MVPPALQRTNYNIPITGSANPYYTWLLYGNGSNYDSLKTENCNNYSSDAKQGHQLRAGALGLNAQSRGISKTARVNNSSSILNIGEDSSWSLDDLVAPGINSNSTDTTSDNVNSVIRAEGAVDDVEEESWEMDDDDGGAAIVSPTAAAAGLKVVQISNPVRVTTDMANFRSLVQRLTGQSPDCTKYWRKLRRMNSRQGVVDVQGEATLQILDAMVDDDTLQYKFTQKDGDGNVDGGMSNRTSNDIYSTSTAQRGILLSGCSSVSDSESVDQFKNIHVTASHYSNTNNNDESVDDLIFAGLVADRPLPDITMLPPLQSNNNNNNMQMQTSTSVEHVTCGSSFLHIHCAHHHNQAVTPTR